MAEIHEFGKKGEEIAVNHLQSKGYEILERNWRFSSNEIDIIAKKDDTLIVVEVKTRKSSVFGEPEVFVTRQKQRNLIKAANVYINYNNIEMETRFDIIGIIMSNSKTQIHHIEDAFYPMI